MPTAMVITVSDSRSAGGQADTSGPTAEAILQQLGFTLSTPLIVPDEMPAIRDAVIRHCGKLDVIVTTGGTGIAARDVTPEAIEPLLEKKLPGFGEIMRTGSYGKTPLSIISRGGAGIIGRTLIVMLPGSPKGVKDCLELVGPAMKHAVKALTEGPLNCQGEPKL